MIYTGKMKCYVLGYHARCVVQAVFVLGILFRSRAFIVPFRDLSLAPGALSGAECDMSFVALGSFSFDVPSIGCVFSWEAVMLRYPAM